MKAPQLYRLESDYPFAGVGQVYSETEWLRIYGYTFGRNWMKFIPVPAEQFDCGPTVNPGLTVGGEPWHVSPSVPVSYADNSTKPAWCAIESAPFGGAGCGCSDYSQIVIYNGANKEIFRQSVKAMLAAWEFYISAQQSEQTE